jgi:hypothetical protein
MPSSPHWPRNEDQVPQFFIEIVPNRVPPPQPCNEFAENRGGNAEDRHC